MALRKPNGSLRPIAIGETIRRLTSKVAVDLITERAREIFEPLQLGVKTPNGCEAIIHVARQWFSRHHTNPDKVAVSVDVSNAFNTVHRAAVLRAVRVHFPSLSPWVDCCYRHESTLFTGSRHVALQSINSARGVQQGDPLGPVLFALAIHPVIAEARAATGTLHPGGIDICSFFLDDGFCAGSSAAVRCFLSTLTAGFRRIGLTVNLDKTEVIPACPLTQSFGHADFPGCSWNGSSNFKLLGAPIGSDAWCEELLGRRVSKARTLLSAIGRLPDAQKTFSLLRSCSGWSKVLYSCRTVPPSAQMCGLKTADSDLRAALSQLIGRPLTDDDWRLASLGVAAGGLGTRCAAEHAPAAYVASFSASRELCGKLWPAFDPFDLDDGCRLAAAEDALRGVIPSGANIYAVSDSPSQRSLSGMVEAQSVSAIFGDSTLPRHRRLHLEACRVPGAGAWLTANPTCVDSSVSSPLFRVALQRRLRVPLWDHDSACGMCGEVLDRWGDHALACCCGGDRVLRHNAIRDVVCSAVTEFTTISPELEKPGLLLPPRPPDPGGPPLDADLSSAASGRRPADVWVPRGVCGSAEAWDFSISSLLRPSHLSSASPSVADVFHEVESRKRAFQDTASLVAQRGATFCPLVLEACGGGWSRALRSVVAWIASESRMARGPVAGSPTDISLRIAQRISCTLHRENARAILRRSPGSVNGSSGLAGDLVPSSGW